MQQPSSHLVLAGLLGCLLLSHGSSSTTQDLAQANADFALRLYNVVRNKVGDGENVFLSPISISTAFAMLYAGANGHTKTELRKVFFDTLPSDSDTAVHQAFSDLLKAFDNPTNNYTLRMANGLFGRSNYNFNDQYLADTEKYYGAGIQRMNFSGDAEGSRETINDWVAEHTMDKIKDLLPDGTINAMTALVLVNAIYFKAPWNVPFKPRDTEQQPFHVTSKKDIQLDMMNNEAKYSYSQVDELDCRVLELPYAGEKVSMYVFIPNKVNGLRDLEEKLTINNLLESLNPDGYQTEKSKVRLPKFNMTFTLSLKDLLRQLGLRDVFTQEIADLSEINGKRDLYVSDAAHKAFVDVNEEGTEAAGGTGIVIGLTSVQQPPPELYADRPFFFIIKEKTTGSVLFMGRYAKPPGENVVVGAFGLRGWQPNSAATLWKSLPIALMWTFLATLMFENR